MPCFSTKTSFFPTSYQNEHFATDIFHTYWGLLKQSSHATNNFFAIFGKSKIDWDKSDTSNCFCRLFVIQSHSFFDYIATYHKHYDMTLIIINVSFFSRSFIGLNRRATFSRKTTFSLWNGGFAKVFFLFGRSSYIVYNSTRNFFNFVIRWIFQWKKIRTYVLFWW